MGGIRLRSSVMLKEVFLGLSLLICYGAGDPGFCIINTENPDYRSRYALDGLTMADLQAFLSDFADKFQSVPADLLDLPLIYPDQNSDGVLTMEEVIRK